MPIISDHQASFQYDNLEKGYTVPKERKPGFKLLTPYINSNTAIFVVKTVRLSLPLDNRPQVSLWFRLSIILADRLSD